MSKNPKSPYSKLEMKKKTPAAQQRRDRHQKVQQNDNDDRKTGGMTANAVPKGIATYCHR